MHSVLEQILESYEQRARDQGSPNAYLRELAPLHNRWHGFSRGARPIGFLLFHWHLIQHFEGAGLEQQMGTTAYTAADFSAVVVVALGLTAALVGAGVSAWWVLPAAVVAVLSLSVARATRG